MRERRPGNKRVPFRFIVRYGVSRPLEYRSFIADFSDTGVYLKTNRILNPGTHILMTIEINKTPYDCEGIVKWAKRVPDGHERITKCGMGIEFSKISQELLDIYNAKIADQ